MDPSQSWRPRADTVVPANHALSYHPPFELYDLARDPWERNDVSGDSGYAPVLAELRSQLASHMQATQDPILKHRRAQSWLEGKTR